jgi:hypothetical protein
LLLVIWHITVALHSRVRHTRTRWSLASIRRCRVGVNFSVIVSRNAVELLRVVSINGIFPAT